jgi:hypothetical protein
MRHGGVFEASPKLEQEMQVQEWTLVERRRGDRKIEVKSGTRKKDLREILHRSPDRLDSLRVFAYGAHVRGALALADPGTVVNEPPPPEKSSDLFDAHEDMSGAGGALDPYAGSDKWGRG